MMPHKTRRRDLDRRPEVLVPERPERERTSERVQMREGLSALKRCSADRISNRCRDVSDRSGRKFYPLSYAARSKSTLDLTLQRINSE